MPTTVFTSDFETDFSPWNSASVGTYLVRTTAQAYAGSYSMAVSSSDDLTENILNDNGVSYAISPTATGKTYFIDYWAYHPTNFFDYPNTLDGVRIVGTRDALDTVVVTVFSGNTAASANGMRDLSGTWDGPAEDEWVNMQFGWYADGGSGQGIVFRNGELHEIVDLNLSTNPRPTILGISSSFLFNPSPRKHWYCDEFKLDVYDGLGYPGSGEPETSIVFPQIISY